MDTNYSIANFNLSVECMIDEIDDFTVEHPIFITTPNQTIANHILRAEALKFTFRDTTHGQTNTYFETVILKLSSYTFFFFIRTSKILLRLGCSYFFGTFSLKLFLSCSNF